MATLPAAYTVQLTTLYLGQAQRLNPFGTMMFVPGIPVVGMLFTKLNVTSQSQASISPGAAITPTLWIRTVVGSYVAVARAMAPTLGYSTRTSTMAAATPITDSALFFSPRALSISKCLISRLIATPGDEPG